jgi:hypothetical protein
MLQYVASRNRGCSCDVVNAAKIVKAVAKRQTALFPATSRLRTLLSHVYGARRGFAPDLMPLARFVCRSRPFVFAGRVSMQRLHHSD